ncbi:hypothetical protein B0H13DRAFT_2565629, partial [Mycena leptocephala]
VEHLALVITMRGAERPAKVAWTRPFLQPLKPLEQDAARQTFIDIADNTHNPEEVDKVLSLTDNMPLAINLLAHLVDSEDAELVQAKLPMDNVLGCKVALIRTALAYSDGNKRLKTLAPIREYMQKVEPPDFHLVRPLLKHFKELLELFMQYRGTQSSPALLLEYYQTTQTYRTFSGMELNRGIPTYQLIGQGPIPFTHQIHNILPRPCDHHLEAYYNLSLFNSFGHSSISIPETLVFETLEHFKHFDDPDIKYYYRRNLDISTAKDFCETSISLALSTQNTKMQSQALTSLAWINWNNGDYFTAQVHANMAQRLARISADLYREAQALHIASVCYHSLGNYKQSISLCSRARDLLALCGMSSGQLDHYLMTTQAEIHKLKSEYVAARSIHFRILQESSVTQNFHTYGFALLNVAGIDVSIGAPKEEIQGVYEKAREIFSTRNLVTEVMMCDVILADLYLREGNLLEAKVLFESCLKSSFKHPQIMSYCLERLGDVSRWGSPNWMSGWTTVFFVHSVRQKEKLGIHKALQFLADVFFAQDDEQTTISLFTVALEGFAWMDVHCSRAECMLRLGDISKGHGHLLKAVELWETARPLFEQSSQVKQVEKIDQRLAGVNKDVLEKHRTNLARLAELNAPSQTVDEINDLSDIEDMEGLDLEDETTLDLLAL